MVACLAQQPRRGRHALGVVAGRVGDHRRRRDLADRVVGAAELERAGALQGLGLEQDAAAGQRVQGLGFQQRRAAGDALQSARGGLHVREGRQLLVHAAGLSRDRPGGERPAARRRAQTPSSAGRPERSRSSCSGPPGRRSRGAPRRLIQTGRRPKQAAPWTSQALDDWKAISPGAHAEPVDRQLVDLGVGLEDADLLDREDRIEQPGDAGALGAGLQHLRLAVGEDRGLEAARAQALAAPPAPRDRRRAPDRPASAARAAARVDPVRASA